MIAIAVDADTREWTRNRSDELAIEAGCRFDVDRAQLVVNWIERYCRLYEGSRGPAKLRDWQYEATMRMFGWVRWSETPRYGDPRWIRRFKKASIFIPKKNAKTPTAAMWALYLLAGDGEDGNHVFFAAADGFQARLAAKHAVEMVKASPDLHDARGGQIAINLTEMKLTYIPNASDAKPISSGDTLAAQRKQGINGSVIIDETHVITSKFISDSSIEMAGIARDEAMHIEVSTAGKDPDSYGRKQYDYGKSVERGEVDDPAFFFLCYEAPQDLTDDDLDADPIKYGRLANPTMGRIVQEDEYLAHYHRAKASLADLADFKTFRLNIWQQTASPWVRLEDWMACRADFTEDDLAGSSCCAGLDLAITRDMSALAFVFPWDDDAFRVLCYFFLPAAGVRRLAVSVPRILDWVRQGHVIETPGETTDYAFIRRLFAEKARKFSVEKLIYDEYNAEHLTQEINEETGIEREKMPQTAGRFNEPTQNLERCILERKLQHNGNPVLSWQMGHVTVKVDAAGNKRPMKPGGKDDVKKIDGVVASIMAFAGARASAGNWYKPGVLGD